MKKMIRETISTADLEQMLRADAEKRRAEKAAKIRERESRPMSMEAFEQTRLWCELLTLPPDELKRRAEESVARLGRWLHERGIQRVKIEVVDSNEED